MSSWGNLDNVAIRGNVIIAVANTVNVLGIGTQFTSNLKSGDYVTIASNKYQVNVITSDTVMTLTDAAATNSVGANVFVQQGPKYIANVAFPANNYSIQNIYGVDREEIGVPENQDRGLSHTGWTHYTTYTDAYSQTRHKAEVLVALSKNFNSNAVGNIQVDANDDTVVADYLIYFTTQPTANVTNANTSLFFVVTDSEPTGATITFQWQENNGNAWVSILDGVDDPVYGNVTYSGNTTNTLSISNVTAAVNGFEYRVIISGDGGADSNTSDSAALTAP